MPNFTPLIDLLNQLFPNQMGTILVFILILAGLWWLWWSLDILSKIKQLFVKDFLPMFYSLEEKRLIGRKRRFADHIESEIRRLNNLEAWSDYRFAELEAEVEAEGKQRIPNPFLFGQRSRTGLRREKSLSKALETSRERLVLLEGEPGSGKSVALRHVTQSMARLAMKARTSKSVIPIYVNLKELKRQKSETIDKNLIQSFVLKSINRANDRDIEEFLEEEFENGMKDGSWLFLFDSFDEIPEVLSSTEIDTIIRNYSDAISDFLHGMNLCRGVVASRQFRGPGQSGWPRFRILQLSEARRAELVRKADLGTELQETITGQLGIAGDEIRGMTSNPMFLGLLCEYMKSGNPFPQNAHSVFETYVETRLNRDQERIERRFKLKPSEVRATAEVVAFCMAANAGLGLSPTRENISTAITQLGFRSPKNINSHLDALEYIKLARSETATAAGDSKPFTFAHRRFQEYFATSIVLREPERVAPHTLLTDARWRETAVVICQTQPVSSLAPLIQEAQHIFEEMKQVIQIEMINDPLKYVNETLETDIDKANLSAIFPWPTGLLHLAGLLQDGFVNHLKDLPDSLRLLIAQILLTANTTGTLSDKKWTLEVAGIVPSEVLLWLLRDAFANGSQWLSEVAFRQTTRLNQIPDDIAQAIRRAIVELYADGRIRRERRAIHAHLARLEKPDRFTSGLRLLLWINHIDLCSHLILIFIVTSLGILIDTNRSSSNSTTVSFGLILLSIIIPFTFISLLSLRPLASIFLRMTFSRRRRLWLRDRHNSFETFIAAEMRFAILPMMFFFPFLALISSELKWILFLAVIMFWAPFSLLAALTGKFVHPLWWLLIPFWPILYLIRNMQKLLTALWKSFAKNIFYLILIIISSVFLLSLIGLTVYLAIENIPVRIIVLLFLLRPIFSTVKNLILWVIDWMRWYRWDKKIKSPLTIQEFLQTLVEYNYAEFRNRFIKTVREQGLLIAGNDTEILINRLALSLEHARLIRNKEIETLGKKPWFKQLLPNINVQDLVKNFSRSNLIRPLEENIHQEGFFDIWLANYQKDSKNELISWGSEFLDEVWRLSEQLRANRRS